MDVNGLKGPGAQNPSLINPNAVTDLIQIFSQIFQRVRGMRRRVLNICISISFQGRKSHKLIDFKHQCSHMK
jgi:hypothetical protein